MKMPLGYYSTPFKFVHICEVLGMTDDQIIAALDSLHMREIRAGVYANEAVRSFRADPALAGLWTDESLNSNPPMRVEFETATALATISDAYNLAKNKSWGRVILSVAPLLPGDRLHPYRVVYILNPENRMRQRWEWRDNMKAMLKRDRGIVNDAMRWNKGEFLTRITPDQRKALWLKLELTPEDFWVRARYGERFGVAGLEKFADTLAEKTEGYRFDFGEAVAV